jgi:hypothetical protein
MRSKNNRSKKNVSESMKITQTLIKPEIPSYEIQKSNPEH